MEENNLRLAILDDHPLIIEGLYSLFSNLENVTIIKGFNLGEELLNFKGINQIDVLLLDVFFGQQRY